MSSQRPPKLYGENHPDRKRLREARERALAILADAFAEDTISLEGFETLVDEAYGCKRPEELEAMLAGVGLHVAGAHPLVPVEADAPQKPLSIRPPGRDGVLVVPPPPGPTFARALFGSVERKGRFSLPDRARVDAILGSVELDLRDVDFPPGVTEIRVRAVLGSIEIIVPAHVAVDCAGSAIFGSFEGTSRVPAVVDTLVPCLRVVGTATLSSIEIRTRPPEHLVRTAQRKRLGSGS